MLFGLAPAVYGWLAAGILTAIVAGGGFYYYKSTQAEIANLNRDLVAYQLAEERNIQTIARMQAEKQATTQALSNLGLRARVAEEAQDDLIRKLHEHDLTNLVSRKPGLTGKAINEGIDEVFADLESITSLSDE